MREIKFRGKRIDNGEWVYGDLFQPLGGTLDYIQSNEKLQQLPDKVVDAIDLFIEDYLPNDTIND